MASSASRVGCGARDGIGPPQPRMLARRRRAGSGGSRLVQVPAATPSIERLHLTHVLPLGSSALVRPKVSFELVLYRILVVERSTESGAGRGREACERGSDWANVGRRRR